MHEWADLGLFGYITAREDARCYIILPIPIPGAAADVPCVPPARPPLGGLSLISKHKV